MSDFHRLSQSLLYLISSTFYPPNRRRDSPVTFGKQTRGWPGPRWGRINVSIAEFEPVIREELVLLPTQSDRLNQPQGTSST